MFSRCMTTRVTGYDQPSFQIMQMLYCFVNNIHVDYEELLWEGFHYSLINPTTMIPYPKFTKLIVSHYMTTFPEILRRARERYHNVADDVMIKSIFKSGKSKRVVGMKIPYWMITDEMKLTENYRLYAGVFGVDVPMTQSQSKGNTGPKNIALSLHKFRAVRFPDNDIEERTSKWNSKAKIFYIRKQQEPRKPKEEVYSNSKIVQIIKTYWELGHEHKFITKIVARRSNGSIVFITKSNYKNINNNDIEDMYLLIVNHKVDDYAETGLLWSLSVFIRSTMIWERVHDFKVGVESYQQQDNLTAPIITFPGIKKYKVFSIISKPVYGIIYENNKKEKRVMRHQEVHKFCDATLKRVLEGLKRYNNDVKYGYVAYNLSKEDVEYLQLFAEEIEERLK
ncbi:hypothetical protein Tco_1236768 [Tanacetum coccineum]